MHRSIRKLIPLIVLMLWWAGPAWAADTSPAHAKADAKTAAECTGAGGVWVIVDLPDKKFASGCASKPANGKDALTQIGVQVSLSPDGKGFICELQGLPDKACATNGGFDKSTGEFWSYWHRSSPSASWTFSEKGAAEYHPEPGTVEGWLWGDGKTPPRWVDTVQPTPAAQPVSPPASGPGLLPIVISIAVVVVIVVIAAVVVIRKRRGGSPL